MFRDNASSYGIRTTRGNGQLAGKTTRGNGQLAGKTTRGNPAGQLAGIYNDSIKNLMRIIFYNRTLQVKFNLINIK